MIELRGGPLDGLQLRPARPAPFLYIEVRGKHRCFRVARSDRALYKAGTKRRDVTFYDYADLLWTTCPGCGVWHRRSVERCTFCGSPLRSRVGCERGDSTQEEHSQDADREGGSKGGEEAA